MSHGKTVWKKKMNVKRNLTCPEFLNFAIIRLFIALLNLAELNTMNGAFPPNSKPMCLMVEEQSL